MAWHTPPPVSIPGDVCRKSYGGHSERETPGPIPNPEVKPFSADGTATARTWESRTPPDIHSVGATDIGGPYGVYVRRRPTLPRPRGRSTIGAERLNFRVRDGTGCFPFAMAAVTLAAHVPRDAHWGWCVPSHYSHVMCGGLCVWFRGREQLFCRFS